MTFTEKANKIFNQAIADYHIKDNIDTPINNPYRSEEHTSELQSRFDLVCRLLLEKKKKNKKNI